MSDFDSNEDFIRLTDADRDDVTDPEEIDRVRFEPPLVRRARLQVEGHYSAPPALGRRVGVTMIARRRHTTRRACPYGRRVPVLATPPRCNRRRLWTECHGCPPGSPS
jgi:hypothetical protein